MALVLEGVLPGLTRLRRPVPVVRFDRVREPRTVANLRGIARRLAASDEAVVAATTVDLRRPETRSGGGATGARVICFTQG